MTGCVVVMGVAGSGKSAVGAALAERLGAVFVDGDDHHPAANVEKMRAGVPLTDSDRAPWLAELRQVVCAELDAGHTVVIACSALTRRFRRQLAAGLPVRFVHLDVSRAVLTDRLRQRTGHFMPATLLDSQLATLEVPAADEALVVDADRPLEPVVDDIARRL